ncbi:MAG: tRNA (cytidine(34)-2'-O)-methyltransferase [Oscillospiraceae bacterium]|jgi:tRNA (cytidine/uridine-2'-O-)-methyltransferase|nr:tRNA (cytidine(34)-2'-O)-methyltransferase [Oscillospiraceae bacterium]
MKLNLVLCEPEIPANTGNISRTCSVIGAKLHLIRPLGFSIEEKEVRRAGLDYWTALDLEVHASATDFFAKYDLARLPMFLVSTKARHVYSDMDYAAFDEVFFVFGKETRGLPEELLRANADKCVRIPMLADMRSLNLSNAAAIVAYEALRQTGFAGLARRNAAGGL